MADQITPALTPEEWASWIQDKMVLNGRGNMLFVSKGIGFMGTERIAVQVSPMDVEKHACAALCLHGQPFGFTWSDVDLLESLATREDQLAAWCPPGHVLGIPDELANMERRDTARRLRSLSDRLQALLPPRQP